MPQLECEACGSEISIENVKENYSLHRGEYIHLDVWCDECDNDVGWISVEMENNRFQLKGGLRTDDSKASALRPAQNGTNGVIASEDIPTDGHFDIDVSIDEEKIGWVRINFDPVEINAHECKLVT